MCGLFRDKDIRLLTLVGPGGVGKTRLAQQVAEELLTVFEGGVYFIELAPITDPQRLVPEIADTLQIQQAPGTPLDSTLKEHLQGRRMLLVLDNFEQIIKAGPIVAEILAACGDLKLLVTSRAPLRLRAEREFTVSPLALPQPGQVLTSAGLADLASVALFMQCAGAVKPDFELVESNAGLVAEICRRVDGLPLGIELVAAYIGILTPQSLLARLKHPLNILTGGATDAPERHQTMRDTIEWSYTLLDEGEQRLFRQVSVFVGGFSLQAAEAVCSKSGNVEIEEDDPQAIEVLKELKSLVDKNLVRRLEHTAGEDSRLTMLETMREYAWEQLTANGEAEVMQGRHAQYYIALAERVNPNHATQEGLEWMRRLKPEEGNFRGALSWLLDQKQEGATVDALRLLQALQHYWERHSQFAEFIGWLERALAQAGPEAKLLQISALKRGAIQMMRQGDNQTGGEWIERALKIARELDDKQEIIECINLQSRVALVLGHYDKARAMMETVLATCREIGNDFMVAGTLINLATVAQVQDDYKSAETLSLQSLDIYRKLDNRTGIMWAFLNIGDSVRHLGRFEEARKYLMEALPLAQASEHPLAADTLAVLASTILTQTMAGSKTSGKHLVSGPQYSALKQAVRLFGLAIGLLERRGWTLEPILLAEVESNIADARTVLGEAFTAPWEEGHAATLDRALQFASEDYEQEEGALPHSSGRAHKQDTGGLTAREYEIATLVVQGITNSEIARRLVLSERTVEMHVSHALHKLGLATRTELAAWAIRLNIGVGTTEN